MKHLIQLLCDPENQPHQFVGDPDELRKAMTPPTPQSETPETDAHILAGTPITWEVVKANFARSLERRLLEAEARIKYHEQERENLMLAASNNLERAEVAERRVERKGSVIVPRKPTEEMGKASGMCHRCKCGRTITQWAINRWDDMLSAAPKESDDKA